MHDFALTCEKIASISSKIGKVETLSEYLSTLEGKDLALACIFFTGSAFAARDTRKLNLGAQMIKKAIAQCVQMNDEEELKKIDTIYLKFSEPGEFAENVLSLYRKKHEVHESMKDLGILKEHISLKNSEDFFNKIFETGGSIAKVNLLSDFYSNINSLDAKYVTKILAADLRIGLKEASVEEAIAKSSDEKSVKVKEANMFIGDIGEVALRSRIHKLDHITITPFWPVKVMLATPAEDASEVISRMGEHLWVEDKYDGVRCQIHKFGAVIRLFSRDQNEITAQFPEIVNYASQIKGDIILDGEIMAFKGGEIMRFFYLQQRLGRKTLSEEFLASIPVEYFVYDILYHDGDQCLNKTLRERREVAEKILGITKTKYNNSHYDGIHFSHQSEIDGVDALEEAFTEAKARVTEGLMIKNPDSSYKPGKRGIDWLKFKKTLEPLDVVITGVEYGHGKRRSQLSDYTFAVRDEKSDELVNIGKAYSGITDAQIKELTEHFLKNTIVDEGRFRTVNPDVVIEVTFESIQKSERHGSSGFALRFPRINKVRIGDKDIKEINTLKDVTEMYEKHFADQDK